MIIIRNRVKIICSQTSFGQHNYTSYSRKRPTLTTSLNEIPKDSFRTPGTLSVSISQLLSRTYTQHKFLNGILYAKNWSSIHQKQGRGLVRDRGKRLGRCILTLYLSLSLPLSLSLYMSVCFSLLCEMVMRNIIQLFNV